MAGQRLGGCAGRALPALLLLLLRPPATPGIMCPTPTSVEHANIRIKSYNLSSRERYICNSGFKRKAGTSSLIECVFNETTNVAHWTIPNLKCISTYAFNSRAVTVAISIPTGVLCGVCVAILLVCYKKSRQTSQIPNTEMEDMPMTGGNHGRE